MTQLLTSTGAATAHHEYAFESTLRQAVLLQMEMIDGAIISQFIQSNHKSAIHYSTQPFWCDSSNALPWIIQPLYETFPNAKFIHLIRDGRKVVSSFYHKFEKIIYADEDVAILNQWINDPSSCPMPPPEKKFWRPIPTKDSADYAAFSEFNRWQRLSYYWQLVNQKIQQSMSALPAANCHFVRLEELTTQPALLSSLFEFIGLPYRESYFEQIQKPVNVAIPKNFQISDNELEQFNAIAGPTMLQFGYKSEREYELKY